MFDRSVAIAEWRTKLASAGTMFEADLDELESHLHDELDGLDEKGQSGEDAFRIATERLGETHVLADEFAKVNPLLAWRAALYWMTLGVLLVLALLPLQQLSDHVVIAGSMALHLGKSAVSVAVWAVAFASPLAFFAVLFPFARRRVESPLALGGSRPFRVTIVLAAVVLALAAHLGCDWGWAFWLEHRLYGARVQDAWHANGNASVGLAIVGPIVLGALVLRHRAEAMKNRASGAPLFWLTIGLFIGCVRCELHDFVRSATLVGGGFAHLRPEQMHRLMWLVTLGCPLLLFTSALAYLKYGAPAPSRLLRAPGLIVTMLISGAIAIAAVFASGSVSRRGYGMLSEATASAGYDAWLLAGIVTSCALPVIVGSLMWSLRQAGSLAVVARRD